MATTVGDLQGLRQANTTRLLDLLQRHGAMHRAELARRSGLSRTTVSTIVASLIEMSVLTEVEAPRAASKADVRRQRNLLVINPSGRVAVGVDVSHESIRVVVATPSHQLMAEATSRLQPDQSWDQALSAGIETIDRALADAGADRTQVIGVGLGLPGPLDLATGVLGLSSNSVAWAGVNAGQELSDRLGLPVHQDNTSRLAALAEANFGAGRERSELLFVKLAAGVGSGMVLSGRIFRGSIGAAGELGHITVDRNGPACKCGNRGCLETYAAVPAVLAALRPVLGESAGLQEVLAATAAGDRACHRVIGDVGEVLGVTLAGVCNLLNPQAIVIGGDLATAGEVLLQPLRDSLRAHALPLIAGAVQVSQAELGDRAGALGGVALVLHEGETIPLPSADRSHAVRPVKGSVAR